MSKHLDLWQELNERQQKTLSAIYNADQNAEEGEKSRWHRGLSKRKASVWRWLEFASPFAHLGEETYLHRTLSEARVTDQGLGSTLDVLKNKGLVECNYYQNARQDSKLLSIKLTNKGRSVSRAGLGETAPKKRPKGQLKPRQWEALMTIHKTGDEGITDDISDYAGFSWRWTWLRLQNYYGDRDGLIEEVHYWYNNKIKHKIVITQKGREFYEKNRNYYFEIYPDIKL